MIWGGSGIEKCTFDYIKKIIPSGSTVIELGSGFISTREFSKIYNLFSIDHNREYIGIYPNVNYIYAPIVDGWYDVSKLIFPTHQLVFIDGINRSGILNNLHLFNKEATFIIHDTYRDNEISFSKKLGEALNRPVFFFDDGDYFSVI
jgi:hypothetical protein